MGMRLANGNWSDALADTPENQAIYGEGSGYTGGAVGYDAPQYGTNYTPGDNTTTPTTTNSTGNDAAMQQYVAAWEKIMKAVAERDERAFQEGIREFDLYFGLDQGKFQEDIRQFNQTYGLNQGALTGYFQGQPTLQRDQMMINQALQAAGLTGVYQGQPTLQAQQQQGEMLGVYQGQPTLAAQLQQANLLGTYQGQPTLQAQQQAYTQGTGLVNLISGMQANPFRQQAALGQLQPLLQGRGVAGFGQIGTVPGAGTGGLGYMQQMIDDIRSGGAANSVSVQQTLDAIPTPNKLNSVEFFRSPQTTQNLVLQGMQEKYGIDPNDALQQIKNTMPGFQAPSTYGTVRRV